MNSEKLQSLTNKVLARIGGAKGRVQTTIPGLRYTVAVSDEKITKCFYDPCFVCILQGRMESKIGTEEFNYGTGDSLVVSCDVPSTYKMIGATAQKPFVGISFTLEKDLLLEIIEKIDLDNYQEDNAYGASLDKISDAMLNTLMQLTELEMYGSEQDKRVLGFSLKYQFYYQILCSKHGSHLVHFYKKKSSKTGILKSIIYFKEHFKENFDIDRVAQDIAYMQPSTFFKHFKESTGFTPLQFKKQLRLIESKKLLEQNKISIAEAAFAVGYESASQFSREFKDFFNLSPSNIKRSIMV